MWNEKRTCVWKVTGSIPTPAGQKQECGKYGTRILSLASITVVPLSKALNPNCSVVAA